MTPACTSVDTSSKQVWWTNVYDQTRRKIFPGQNARLHRSDASFGSQRFRSRQPPSIIVSQSNRRSNQLEAARLMDHRRHRIDRSRCSTPSKFVLHRRCHSRPVPAYTRSIRCRIGRSAETSLDCRVSRCELRTNVPRRSWRSTPHCIPAYRMQTTPATIRSPLPGWLVQPEAKIRRLAQTQSTLS